MRAARTGHSAVIDAAGGETWQSALNESVAETHSVRLMEVESSYTQWGDTWCWLCLVLFGGASVWWKLRGAPKA